MQRPRGRLLDYSDGEPSRSSSLEDGNDKDDANNDDDGNGGDANVNGVGHEDEEQSANLQQVVEVLTTSVSSLTTTVHDLPRGIRRLKLKNKTLQHSHSSSSKTLKRLVRGPSGPSYKNFRVSSSSSCSDDAARQGEKVDEDEDSKVTLDAKGENIDAGYGSSLGNQQYPIVQDQPSPRINVSGQIPLTEYYDVCINVSAQDKGKGIVVEQDEHPSLMPIHGKALEEELSRHSRHANSTSWLGSIMEEELKNGVMERLKMKAKNVKKVYETSERSYSGCCRIYSGDFDKRSIEKMVYLYEHRFKWKEIFAMTNNMIGYDVDSPKIVQEQERVQEQVLQEYLNEEEELKAILRRKEELKRKREEKRQRIERDEEYKKTLNEVEKKKQSILVESQLKEVTPSHHDEVVIPTVFEDPEERKRLLAEFLEVGCSPDVINNCSTSTLKEMYEKMKARDAEKARIRKETCHTPFLSTG
ncbi:hypothetical protein L1987_01951 [Smallanthus sonchifolius]|uniref:Uncharacterized protein n=1 Tax=Smallanthus sonchifolius TaxID=185202 RepID=A0ACB9K6F7_9ASTR|nr:hypothetical protein L1987_01951 [Smallanthus sonchifolius]